MSQNILKEIYAYMEENHSECFQTTQSEKDFVEQYIVPLRQTDPESAQKMESMFYTASVDAGERDFICGFKTGVSFVFECMGSSGKFNL